MVDQYTTRHEAAQALLEEIRDKGLWRNIPCPRCGSGIAQECNRISGDITPCADRIQTTLNNALKMWDSSQYGKVNRPQYYTSHPSGVDCIDVARHHNFNVGNALKYLWRAGRKDGESTSKDLRKAVWYLIDEIATLDGDTSIREALKHLEKK